MKPHLAALLAASLAAQSAFAAAVAEELGGSPSNGDEPAETPATGGRGRGRPRGGAAKDDAPKGKTEDELLEMIEPYVNDGKGEKVKKIIAKHANGGLLADLANLPQNQAAFEKDLKALDF